ncbi:MAG: ABC transporter substrate-binding protein [Deltaproteobacteria bacterium]|nr:ABC transporter substrate-binding protein [Deltaproteobacteria bacterium]
MRLRTLFFATVLMLVVSTGPLRAQTKVRINWTAVTGAQSGVYVAQEEGLFKKNGLEVELIHIPSSSRGIQAILAGELAFSTMDGLNAVQANLKGAGLALVAGATNRFVFSLMSRPEIKKISDLKGKKIGITRIGSSTHTATLYALSQAGLKTGDYQILPLMEVPNIFTALVAGQIDAGTVSPPTNSRARKAGLNELMNLAKEGPEYVSVAIGTSRSYIKANEDTVRRVVRAYAEALYLFKTNKTVAIRVLGKYTRVKEQDILEDAYSQFHDYLESIPYVSTKGMEAIISEAAEKDPAAKQSKPEDFLDMRFVAELDKEGFFKKLWGK